MIGTRPCRANLGDTMDQCVARYGPSSPSTGVSDPAKTGAPAALFSHDGYDVEVYLLHGVVECEYITKTDKSFFSDADKKKVVASESAAGKWANPVTDRGQTIWMRSDGASIFTFNQDSPLIMAMSASYLQLAAKNKANSAAFPPEDEVKKFVVPGIKVEDVIQKFGVPSIRTPQDKNTDLLLYLPRPSAEKATFAYAGFEVIVKSGKVTDLSIIHGNHTIAK